MKLVLLPSKIWKLFAPFVQEKDERLTAFGKIQDQSWTSTAPSCFPCRWCKWKGVANTYYYSTGRDLP